MLSLRPRSRAVLLQGRWLRGRLRGLLHQPLWLCLRLSRWWRSRRWLLLRLRLRLLLLPRQAPIAEPAASPTAEAVAAAPAAPVANVPAPRRVVMPQTGPRPTYSAPPPPPGGPPRTPIFQRPRPGYQGNNPSGGPGGLGGQRPGMGQGMAPGARRPMHPTRTFPTGTGWSGRTGICSAAGLWWRAGTTWVWESTGSCSGRADACTGRGSGTEPSGTRGIAWPWRSALREEQGSRAQGIQRAALWRAADSAGRCADHEDDHGDGRHLGEGPGRDAGCAR